MEGVFRIRRAMTMVFVFCFILLVPSVLAWIVNVELAFRSLMPGWHFFEVLMPAGMFRVLTPLAADLSTVTTLTPILVLIFPMIQSIRVIRRINNGISADELAWLPYPDRFSFFLVMLGLAGTLYGLLIGISVSGVGSLSGAANTASISDALEHLLDGTATALLSSLAGLAGAFVAAEPGTWVFKRLAGCAKVEEDTGLAEVLEVLTNDLKELSNASREVRNSIGADSAGKLFGTLERIDEAVAGTLGRIDGMKSSLERISSAQEQAAVSLDFLKRLESIDSTLSAVSNKLAGIDGFEQIVRSVDGKLTGIAGSLEKTAQSAAKANESMETLIKETNSRGLAVEQGLAGVAGAVRENSGEMSRDREAVRKAFALYGNTK